MRKVGELWFYIKVLALGIMIFICLKDIARDVVVRSFGKKHIAKVVEFNQVKKNQFEIEMEMSHDSIRRFRRKVSDKTISKYGKFTELSVQYHEKFPDHIVCPEIDKRVWLNSTIALLAFAAFLFGVVKRRI